MRWGVKLLMSVIEISLGDRCPDEQFMQVRRADLVNDDCPQELELTSYGEIELAAKHAG